MDRSQELGISAFGQTPQFPAGQMGLALYPFQLHPVLPPRLEEHQTRHMHKVTEYDKSYKTDSDEDDLSCLELHNITEVDRTIIWITTEVSGVKLKMELDTGSALSVISEADYKRLFSKLQLEKTPVMLKIYTGERVSPKRKPKVDVTYGDKTHKLELCFEKWRTSSFWARVVKKNPA